MIRRSIVATGTSRIGSTPGREAGVHRVTREVEAQKIRRPTLLAALVLGAAVLVVPAQAAPGDLDPSFGSGGTVTTDFGDRDRAAAVAIQADGKILAAGNTCCSSPGGSDFALARYNADGSLDTSFGSGGTLTTDIGAFDFALATAIQPDGKIVAVGRTGPSGTGDFALARYNPNGSLDASFGSAGKVTTDFGGLDVAYGVAIQPDGKIMVAGGGGTPGDFALARYNADGSFDTSFGMAGKVTTDFDLGLLDGAMDVALQSNGRIIAVGFTTIAGSAAFALARYNTDGSLDTSFGNGGKVTTDFGGSDTAFAMAIQPDGMIVVVGTGAGNFGDFTLARYMTDGSLDANFGSGGKVTTDFVGPDSANAVALQANGKIVAAGSRANFRDFALARYNTDGSLDASFGSGGKLTTDFGGQDAAFGVAIQPDGNIVLAGNGGADFDFALARYLGDPTSTIEVSGHGVFGRNGEGRVSFTLSNEVVTFDRGTQFSFTGEVESVSGEGKEATLTGTGTWNGQSGYPFTVSVVDNAPWGRNKDTIDAVVHDPTGVIVLTSYGPQILKQGDISVTPADSG